MKFLDDPGRLEALFAETDMRGRMPWLARYPWRLFQLQRWEYLCRLGDRVEHLVLFLSGTLAVSVPVPQGRTYLVSFCDPGTLVCGDVEVAKGGAHATADVRAEEASWCAAIPLDPYREALLSDLEFLRYAFARLAGELVKDSTYAASNLLAPLEERLAGYIVNMARDGVFRANLTRISELLGVSYRQLARVMRSFRENGWLLKVDRDWRITDLPALQKLGENEVLL